MNEQNKRHIDLAFNIINEYKNSKIKYPIFVNRLNEIIQNFDNPNPAWLQLAEDLWFNFEEINALILSESSNILPEKYSEEITDALAKFIDHLKSFDQKE